jgi:23S rRNA pseudouridine2605 synthase
MHPSFGVLKTYLATVPGPVGKQVGRRLRAGVQLEDGPAAVDSFRVVQAHGNQAIVEVVLHEGRKHIVRRLLAEVGHPVSRLVRTRIGPVHLGGQRAGTLRPLTRSEIADLHGLAEAAPS